MEPKMINLKVLSTVAALALVLPATLPSATSAQGMRGGGSAVSGGGGARAGGGGVSVGGGGFRGGMGGGAMAAGGGNFRATAPAIGGRANFAGNPGYVGGAVRGPAYAGGNWNRGNWNGGNNWNGGWRHHRNGAFYPGLVAGAVVGGALANSYAYYGDPYYGNGYYDDGYYDDSSVAVVPGGGDDAAYCAQRYRSWDPASRTYLGYDGQRYPCP
jgi:BA14K-like protein